MIEVPALQLLTFQMRNGLEFKSDSHESRSYRF